MNTSNVITAVVVGGRATAVSKRYMTDRGQYLNIIGLDLPEVFRVDFSNDEHKGNYVRMVGNDDGVLVPSQYLASGLDVWAFPVLVTETAERTLATIRIININRPANNVDPQPEPEQESAIDQAIAALNTAVERTAQDVISADQSAQDASADADRAEAARDAAEGYAQNASDSASAAATSASQASASAQSASQSASQTAQIKTDVEGMVDGAQASAAASAQSASAAAQSASSAATSAQTATTKAAEASTSASSAATSASTAGTKASEASASASTASAKASEAAQSASTASTKATEANTAKTAAQTAQTAAETAQGLAEDAQEAAETAAQSIEASAAQIATNTSDIADVKRDLSETPGIVNSDADNVDLDISDSSGNVVMRLADGHIKTKNFDSSDVELHNYAKTAPTDDDADLNIADTDGNVIARFFNGHIKTKNFDSSEKKGDEIGLIYSGVPTNGMTVFSNDDVTSGDVVSIAFTACKSGYGCYIEILDTRNRRITYIGRASNGSEADYATDYTIPSDFGKAVVSCVDTIMIVYGIAKKESYAAKKNEIIVDAKIDHPKTIDFSYSLENRLANPIYETYEHYNAEHLENPIEETDAIYRGATGSAPYRIPTVVVTNAGTILVAAEHRTNALGDYGDFSVDVARKTTGGEWTLTEVIPFDSSRTNYGSCLNPEFLVDRNTGRIYLFYGTEKQAVVWWDVTTADGDLRYVYSDDDGESWSDPVSLKSLWDADAYEYCIPSCTKGITLTNGTLVVPCFSKKIVDGTRLSYSLLLIKPINGDWYLSSVATLDGVKNLDECTVVEGSTNNSIWLYCRQNSNYPTGAARGYHKFIYNVSEDTFTAVESTFDVNRSNCMCVDRITINNTLIYLLTLTDTNDSTRKNITLWASLDGDMWIRVYRMYKPSGNGYSVVDNYNGLIAVAYEKTNGNVGCQNISALSTLIYDSANKYINQNISIQDRMQMLFNAVRGLE